MKKVITICSSIIGAWVLIAVSGSFAYASKVDELKGQISEQEGLISEIEEEIKEFNNRLEEVGGQKKTLINALEEIDLTQQRLAADIRVTENKVSTRNLTIDKLELEIGSKEREIVVSNEALSQSIRRINELDSNTLVESLLSYSNLADVWASLDSLEQFQSGVSTRVTELRRLKEELRQKIGEQEAAKSNLIALQSQLTNQNTIIEGTKQQKNDLLELTQHEEANYRRLIDEKESLREEFERELQAFEAQLQKELDPDAVPDAGAIFNWPLDGVRITQHFGGTAFAARNPHVYGRPFHNGTDFGAPVGTKIYAPLGGTVIGAGNTDIFPKCLSYGKWLLIDHHNGLTTLYAHLSLIGATPGQPVQKGDVIGFVGNTGYSTGPHLHFTVYQTEGVDVVRLGDVKTRTNCPDAEIPVAPFDAYLDPLQYLPQI